MVNVVFVPPKTTHSPVEIKRIDAIFEAKEMHFPAGPSFCPVFFVF